MNINYIDIFIRNTKVLITKIDLIFTNKEVYREILAEFPIIRKIHIHLKNGENGLAVTCLAELIILLSKYDKTVTINIVFAERKI